MKAIGMFPYAFNFCNITSDLEASNNQTPEPPKKGHHGTHRHCTSWGSLGVNFCLCHSALYV